MTRLRKQCKRCWKTYNINEDSAECPHNTSKEYIDKLVEDDLKHLFEVHLAVSIIAKGELETVREIVK